jgi:hypothetical protein
VVAPDGSVVPIGWYTWLRTVTSKRKICVVLSYATPLDASWRYGEPRISSAAAPPAASLRHSTDRARSTEVPLNVVLGRWDPPEEAPRVTRACRRVETTPGRD